MQEAQVFLILSALVIVAGFGIIVLGLRHRGKMLEMLHRERLAMIERGLAPSPEHDPGRLREPFPFQGVDRTWPRHPRARPSRTLSMGIFIIAVGLGFAMLIGFAADTPRVGVGIGGAIALLGAAFVVMALLAQRDDAIGDWHPPSPPPPPSPIRPGQEPARDDVGDRT